MRRRRSLGLLLLVSPLFVGLLAISIIGIGTSPRPPATAAPAAGAQPASAALPVSLGSIAPSEPRDASPWTLEGHVLNAASGAVIPGAEITFSQGGASASVRSGFDGA